MAKQILPNWRPDAKEAVRVDKRGERGAGRSSRLIPVKNATQVNPGEEIAARENRIFNGHRVYTCSIKCESLDRIKIIR